MPPQIDAGIIVFQRGQSALSPAWHVARRNSLSVTDNATKRRVFLISSTHSRTLGKYRLIARLGQGGMAEVFLSAVSGPAGFNKLQVIKLMKPDLLDEPEHKAMFLDEGKIAARLNHPNIVQTHEVQIQGEQYFMAMEYLDGQPLHRILRRANKTNTHFPLHWHLHVLTEVLAALEYAHDLKDYDGTPLRLVHRDVTPHNVFVTYAGLVKLCDFGIAKTMASSVETRAGVLRGKVAYMSPEQVLGTRMDPRADLFSVGIMLWEAVCGQRMWHGYSEIHIMQALSQGEIPNIRSVDPSIDPELDQVLARALAPNPEQRYQTAAEFRRAIENFLFTHTSRVDWRKVGEWVSQLFEKERVNLQAVIQDQMTGPQSAPASLDTLRPPHVAMSGDSSPSKSEHVPYSPNSQPASRAGSLTIPSVEVRAMKPRRTLAAAIGVAAALGLVLVFAIGILVIRSTHAESSDVEPTKGGSSPDLAGNPTPRTLQPEAPPPAPRVHLRIKATPSNAQLIIDGKSASENPLIVDQASDDVDHELRVEAKGYETETRFLKFNQNNDIEIALKKSSGVARTPPGKKPEPEDKLPEPKVKKKPASSLDPEDPWK